MLFRRMIPWVLVFANAVRRSAARVAMMAMTASNSISVKPWRTTSLSRDLVELPAETGLRNMLMSVRRPMPPTGISTRIRSTALCGLTAGRTAPFSSVQWITISPRPAAKSLFWSRAADWRKVWRGAVWSSAGQAAGLPGWPSALSEWLGATRKGECQWSGNRWGCSSTSLDMFYCTHAFASPRAALPPRFLPPRERKRKLGFMLWSSWHSHWVFAHAC